jgi:hypothetical protein
LQQEQILRIKIEAFSLDSTSVKVHPDGTGAFKKTTALQRTIRRARHHHTRLECASKKIEIITFTNQRLRALVVASDMDKLSAVWKLCFRRHLFIFPKGARFEEMTAVPERRE